MVEEVLVVHEEEVPVVMTGEVLVVCCNHGWVFSIPAFG